MDSSLDTAPLISNAEVARSLFQVAALLELMECNPFRVRAYRRAALAVLLHHRSVAEAVASGEALTLPGVGDGLSARIVSLVNTGHMGVHDTLLEEIGEPMATLLSVEGIGPRTAIRLVSELGVANLSDVVSAARDGRIRELRGFGPRREERIARAAEGLLGAA